MAMTNVEAPARVYSVILMVGRRSYGVNILAPMMTGSCQRKKKRTIKDV